MKKVVALVCALTMLTVVSYATEETQTNSLVITDEAESVVKISAETGNANKNIFLEVYYSDKEEDLQGYEGDYLDIVAHSEQIKADSDGKIDVSFKLRETLFTGNYTVVLSGKGYKESASAYILNEGSAELLLEEMKDVVSEKSEEEAISEIASELKSGYSHYGIKEDYAEAFADKAWNSVSGLAYEYMTADEATDIDAEGFCGMLNKAVAIVALENGLVDNVISDALIFGIDKGELAEWYSKDFVTEVTGERMAERLEGKTFDTFEKFDAALTESYVMSVIEKPDGAGNTKAVMQEFSQYIGAGESGTDKRYAYVSNKNWESYADLKEAFDGYTEPSTPSGLGSGSGGGSGSSGSRVPSVAITTAPSSGTQTQPEQKIYPLSIFSDLDSVAWAEDAIIALAESGVINGVGNDLFAPNDFVTREEFAAMVVRAFIPDVQAVEISFDDAAPSAWYYDSVAKAYAVGIVNGESERSFGTGKNITRQDMAVMLHRVSKYIDSGITDVTEYEEFSDDNLISDYAKEAVYTFREAGIINGVSNTEFAPLETATRAQAAKMIYGLLEL